MAIGRKPPVAGSGSSSQNPYGNQEADFRLLRVLIGKQLGNTPQVLRFTSPVNEQVAVVRKQKQGQNRESRCGQQDPRERLNSWGPGHRNEVMNGETDTGKQIQGGGRERWSENRSKVNVQKASQ
ncbi:hypothetical protein AMECASPLE_003997 [Ameca splendens]|uniref:Uncharacterized protein n=1 Tax=Ameca splendens TaxID=208324 RepID=A0ABV0ZIJ2_9TELE